MFCILVEDVRKTYSLPPDIVHLIGAPTARQLPHTKNRQSQALAWPVISRSTSPIASPMFSISSADAQMPRRPVRRQDYQRAVALERLRQCSPDANWSDFRGGPGLEALSMRFRGACAAQVSLASRCDDRGRVEVSSRPRLRWRSSARAMRFNARSPPACQSGRRFGETRGREVVGQHLGFVGLDVWKIDSPNSAMQCLLCLQTSQFTLIGAVHYAAEQSQPRSGSTPRAPIAASAARLSMYMGLTPTTLASSAATSGRRRVRRRCRGHDGWSSNGWPTGHVGARTRTSAPVSKMMVRNPP